MSYTLFTEKFRPQSVNDMIIPESYKQFFLKQIEKGEITNLLLYSSTPGAGKTSIAKAICNDLDADYLYLNISSESGVDTLRTDIARFASGKSLGGKKKIVICDEFDGASQKFQMAMRAAMEEFQNTCRFILTCNYVNKIIPALRSRLMEYDFNMNTPAIREEMIPKVQQRLKMVLQFENVEYVEDVVNVLAETLYPDIRKMYGMLQQYSIQNGLIDSNIFGMETSDDELFDLVMAKKYTQARQFVTEAGYNFNDMYSQFFEKLLPRITDPNKKGQIITIIADYQFKASYSVNPEIPFAAMLYEVICAL